MIITLYEMDNIAKQSSEVPDNLKGFERTYFMSVASIYEYYRLRLYSLKKAKSEKQKIVSEYQKAKELFHKADITQKLKECLDTVVLYDGSQYRINGLTMLKNSYQVILEDIIQPKSTVIVRPEDVEVIND